MTKKPDRLERIEERLTPKAAVLSWMESSFQRFDDINDLVDWIAEAPRERHFVATASKLAGAAGMDAKNRGGDPVAAYDETALEASFLYCIALGANRGVLSDLVNEGIMVAYCARGLQLLLFRDAVSQDVSAAADYIDQVAFQKEKAGEDASAEQALVERLASYQVDKFLTEGGMEYAKNRATNAIYSTDSGPVLPAPPTQLQEIRSKLSAHLVGVYINRQAIEVVSRNYFDGKPILFPAGRRRLDAAVEMAEALVEEFNAFVQDRLDRFTDEQLLHAEKPGADPQYPDGLFIVAKQIRSIAASGVRDMVADVVRAAKAEALGLVGRADEAARANLDLLKKRGRR